MKGNSRVILIVDDEMHLRNILKKILEREGYLVELAGDGKAALDKFKKHRPDLLITDLRMPTKGGSEMLSEIERISPTTKVILVTGYPLSPSVQQKVAEGRYLFFAKPFDNDSLIQKVKEVFT